MPASLETSTPEEQCSVIRFLLSKGKKPAEMNWRTLKQYSEKCLSRRNAYKWTEYVKSERTRVTDIHLSEPVEVSIDALQNRIN
ncbi:hypothetical protein Trydic_g22384 [Trypoxylus dichotomus]